MQRYKIKYYTLDQQFIETIQYKCLICGYIHIWDDTWDETKKTEVKAEVETHYNDHIIPQN